jgi:hypothetical protein
MRQTTMEVEIEPVTDERIGLAEGSQAVHEGVRGLP